VRQRPNPYAGAAKGLRLTRNDTKSNPSVSTKNPRDERVRQKLRVWIRKELERGMKKAFLQDDVVAQSRNYI
jgi:hypothetical protein